MFIVKPQCHSTLLYLKYFVLWANPPHISHCPTCWVGLREVMELSRSGVNCTFTSTLPTQIDISVRKTSHLLTTLQLPRVPGCKFMQIIKNFPLRVILWALIHPDGLISPECDSLQCLTQFQFVRNKVQCTMQEYESCAVNYPNLRISWVTETATVSKHKDLQKLQQYLWQINHDHKTWSCKTNCYDKSIA